MYYYFTHKSPGNKTGTKLEHGCASLSYYFFLNFAESIRGSGHRWDGALRKHTSSKRSCRLRHGAACSKSLRHFFGHSYKGPGGYTHVFIFMSWLVCDLIKGNCDILHLRNCWSIKFLCLFVIFFTAGHSKLLKQFLYVAVYHPQHDNRYDE